MLCQEQETKTLPAWKWDIEAKKQQQKKLDCLDLKSQMSTNLRTHFVLLLLCTNKSIIKTLQKSHHQGVSFSASAESQKNKFFGPMGWCYKDHQLPFWHSRVTTIILQSYKISFF